ncbi:FadR/GntR family transcriptional regulator [Streptomyces sp. NPDC050619]|uniref:FadR/GntR family transcriptional regulator n=1 Tax=Streptomyces sp. NPDC050619 TaxID=3157214 RepID=UPI0034403910
MSLTDKAIEQIRELIRSGALPPGSKLPPEPDLAAQLGLSRNLAREAVKALAVARVLEVRRGDGTYVTSLQPSLLLEGLGGAVDLLQSDAGALLDLMEVRRLLEPVATALAATRISDEGLAEVKGHLDAMREARDDVERLNAHDAAFHRAVVAATGNESLVTLLEGVSGRTLRARIWRGLVDSQAAGRTLAEHEAIFSALSRRDTALSQATALLHISNTEQWLREHLSSTPVAPETPAAYGP